VNEELRNTKTLNNLATAFAGESQAHAKYKMFAAVARKEGHHAIARIFDATAENELYHAKMWLRHMGQLGDTLSNLKKAAEGENYEWTDMYAQMSKDALDEGQAKISAEMKLIGQIEKDHETRYNEFISHLEKGTLYARDKEVTWECLNCGFNHKGKSAPQACPACAHPQGWFTVV